MMGEMSQKMDFTVINSEWKNGGNGRKNCPVLSRTSKITNAIVGRCLSSTWQRYPLPHHWCSFVCFFPTHNSRMQSKLRRRPVRRCKMYCLIHIVRRTFLYFINFMEDSIRLHQQVQVVCQEVLSITLELWASRYCIELCNSFRLVSMILYMHYYYHNRDDLGNDHSTLLMTYESRVSNCKITTSMPPYHPLSKLLRAVNVIP